MAIECLRFGSLGGVVEIVASKWVALELGKWALVIASHLHGLECELDVCWKLGFRGLESWFSVMG